MLFNRSDRPEGQRNRRPGGMRRRRKVYVFCAGDAEPVDYKNVATLKKYISERDKILPHRITGNCTRHQRTLTLATKRARHIALLPYQVD